MTGFYLSLGYCSRSKDRCSIDDIVKVCRNISLEKFMNKCIEYGVRENVVMEYIEKYKTIPSDDATIFINYDDRHGDIMQLASGYEESRYIKEKVRKAFGILVLDECYKRGWNINFIIA